MKIIFYIFLMGSLFYNSTFAQNDSISIERYFKTLPYRIYYWQNTQRSFIEYQGIYLTSKEVTVDNYEIKLFQIRQNDTLIYRSLRALDQYYYYVPEYIFEDSSLVFTLPGDRSVFFEHNIKPFPVKPEEYSKMIEKLELFAADIHSFHFNKKWMERYNEEKYYSGILLGVGYAYAAYWAFNIKTSNTLEKIGTNSLGILFCSISLGGVISEISNRIRYNRIRDQQQELIQKYN